MNMDTHDYECLYFVGFSGHWSGFLDLGGLPITHLPDNMDIIGFMDLINCRCLENLPSGLVVHGVLDLRGCDLLSSLPEDIKVGLKESKASIKTFGSVWVDRYSVIKNIVKPEGVVGTIGKS